MIAVAPVTVGVEVPLLTTKVSPLIAVTRKVVVLVTKLVVLATRALSIVVCPPSMEMVETLLLKLEPSSPL